MSDALDRGSVTRSGWQPGLALGLSLRALRWQPAAGHRTRDPGRWVVQRPLAGDCAVDFIRASSPATRPPGAFC
jgi:hypothetical protein